MFEYGVFYIATGGDPHMGAGVHGLLFNELPAARYAKVPYVVGPDGYHEKPTGVQLKNEEYNPTYKAWGYSIKLKDAPVCKEADITMVDAWQGVATDNAAECALTALQSVLAHADLQCKHVIIYTATSTLANAVKKAKNNPNDNNKVVLELIAALGDKITTAVIKDPKLPGIAEAVRNWSYGVAGSTNGYYQPTWITTNLLDRDYWEGEKPVPVWLRSKWLYQLTNQPIVTVGLDGAKVSHVEYFLGEHNKSADDVELLGDKLSDAGFNLVFYPGTAILPIFERIQNYHSSNLWGNVPVTHRYDCFQLININNINKPKLLWELQRVDFRHMWLKNDRNDLISVGDELISKMLRPPMLSYRVTDEVESVLRHVLYSYLVKTGHAISAAPHYSELNLKINDITSAVFDGKKYLNWVGLVDVCKEISVETTQRDQPIPIRLVRGIDLPPRSLLSNIADCDPKVSVVCWATSPNRFMYATIVESNVTADSTERAYGVWCGVYSSFRVIIDE